MLTECPLLMAISLRLVNTNGAVSGLGLNSVFWLFLEFCAVELSEAFGNS